MLHYANELSPAQREVVESLLGRPLDDDEYVTPDAIKPPSEQQRKEAIEGLKEVAR